MQLPFFRSTPPIDFEATLPNGLRLQVGFVRPAMSAQIVAGYQRLTERSRRMRFFGQVSGLSSKQIDFLASPDGRNHIAYAAEELLADARAPVGIARCIRLDADSKMAEVAMTVVDDYQAKGVGTLLHACLHRHAAAVDIRQFIYDVAPENRRFVEHLNNLGADLISRDGDIVRLTLPVFGSAKAVGQSTPAAERFKQALAQIYEV